MKKGRIFKQQRNRLGMQRALLSEASLALVTLAFNKNRIPFFVRVRV